MAIETEVTILGGTTRALCADVRDVNGTKFTQATTDTLTRTVTNVRTGAVLGEAQASLVVADSIFDSEQSWARPRTLAGGGGPNDWYNVRDVPPADLIPNEACKLEVAYKLTPATGPAVVWRFILKVRPVRL